MSFSSKDDAESSRNFIKILVLDPQRAKLVQMSLRKVDAFAKTCPGGPIWAHMGPIWAHMGPYGAYTGPYGPQPGPGPNPEWAPTRTRHRILSNY